MTPAGQPSPKGQSHSANAKLHANCIQEDCQVPESLPLAQQEIWRLQDAVKTLEVCHTP